MKKDTKLIIIKFYTIKGCGSCVRMQSKILDVISEDRFRARFKIDFIDRNIHQDKAREDCIKDVPTILFPTGRREVGIVKKEILVQQLNKCLNEKK